MTDAYTLLQDGVPVLVVVAAAAWLVRRWLRPAPSACAGCEHSTPPQPPVRHRLPVLSAQAPKQP